MLNNNVVSQLTSLSKNKMQPITVVTGIKYDVGLLKTLNKVTFAYDPNWEYDKTKPTYPISFFYVKSMTEQMTSEVSRKPMLFYDTIADGTDASKGGLMNIVADNIIIKPKEYKIDIIIPANSSTFSNNSFSFDQITSVHNFLYNFLYNKNRISGDKTLANILRTVNTGIGIIETLLKALYGTSLNAGSILNMLLEQQDYNKASLEYMWSNRRIIKLKMWNGWKFKYLIIKSLDITKNGDNGDYYEGSLACQEVPILTFRNQSIKLALNSLNKISSLSGNLIKVGVNAFIKAMETTVGEK